MEYVIYYEQSQQGWDNPKPEQKIFSGTMDLPSLPGKKKTKVTTEPIVIHADSINQKDWVSGRVRTGGEGNIHGIRGRLYLKTASGREIMREFCYPASLSTKKFTWKGGTLVSSKSG